MKFYFVYFSCRATEAMTIMTVASVIKKLLGDSHVVVVDTTVLLLLPRVMLGCLTFAV